MAGDEGLVQRYLEHVRVEKRLAGRTVELYRLDLLKLSEFANQASVELLQVQTTHIRQWVARMHSGGRSPRGIALVLSGWRGFYAWLGRESLVQLNPVIDVRAPKAPKPLPKALSVDDAVQLASFKRDAANPWLEARDAAMVELLYGSGLRVGELTGLDVAASKEARGWLDLAGAEAHVLGKGSKRRSVPMGAKAIEALGAWLAVREQGFNNASPPQAALFIGQNGTRLTAQSIWSRLRTRSLQHQRQNDQQQQSRDQHGRRRLAGQGLAHALALRGLHDAVIKHDGVEIPLFAADADLAQSAARQKRDCEAVARLIDRHAAAGPRGCGEAEVPVLLQNLRQRVSAARP